MSRTEEARAHPTREKPSTHTPEMQARVFDRLAAVYDRVWPRYMAETHDLLLDGLEIRSGLRLLDVGCGTGELESRLITLDKGLEIVALDASSGMIERARDKLAGHPNVTFVRAPARSIPLPDQSIDLVLSASAFHYFPDPVRALREIRRVLSDEGRIALLDWCRESAWMWMVDRSLRMVDPSYVRAYTRDDLLEMGTRSRLKIVALDRSRVGCYDIMVMHARR